MLKRAALAMCIASAASLASPPAHAAGLYFADRGVRPLGRAGAFIAGADDLGAIAYNPAGIFDAGGQVLFDGSWVNFTSDYTRQSILRQVDPNTGEPVGSFVQTFPTVNGTTPFLPIPTIVGSYRLNQQWVAALGVWAPYATLTSYPDDRTAPQRYSLLTLDGSLLAFVGGGLAYSPIKNLRLGATIGMLTGLFKTQVVFSGCVPERFLCAPEDPDWDVRAQLNAGPIFAPTGRLGAIYIPSPKWRIGASFQLPVWVRTSATVKTRLPATPLFEKASQEGDSADVSFDLPWELHLGVEGRFIDNLRIELAGGYQHWKMHDKISVTPNGIALKNVAGFPQEYFIPPVDLTRNFQSSASVHLGGEYSLPVGDYSITARGGVSFESSAVPSDYLPVLTLDSNKVTGALGGSFHYGKWRFDATFAHVFAFGATVAPEDAKLTPVSPVEANPPKNANTINGGIYSFRANIIGLGLAYTFDAAPAPEADGAAASAAAPAAR